MRESNTVINKGNKMIILKQILTMEMNYLQRSARILRLEQTEIKLLCTE